MKWNVKTDRIQILISKKSLFQSKSKNRILLIFVTTGEKGLFIYPEGIVQRWSISNAFGKLLVLTMRLRSFPAPNTDSPQKHILTAGVKVWVWNSAEDLHFCPLSSSFLFAANFNFGSLLSETETFPENGAISCKYAITQQQMGNNKY